MTRPRGSNNRNISITPKGLAMLAAVDRGELIPITTAEARARNGRANLIKINAKRKGTTA